MGKYIVTFATVPTTADVKKVAKENTAFLVKRPSAELGKQKGIKADSTYAYWTTGTAKGNTEVVKVVDPLGKIDGERSYEYANQPAGVAVEVFMDPAALSLKEKQLRPVFAKESMVVKKDKTYKSATKKAAMFATKASKSGDELLYVNYDARKGGVARLITRNIVGVAPFGKTNDLGAEDNNVLSVCENYVKEAMSDQIENLELICYSEEDGYQTAHTAKEVAESLLDFVRKNTTKDSTKEVVSGDKKVIMLDPAKLSAEAKTAYENLLTLCGLMINAAERTGNIQYVEKVGQTIDGYQSDLLKPITATPGNQGASSNNQTVPAANNGAGATNTPQTPAEASGAGNNGVPAGQAVIRTKADEYRAQIAILQNSFVENAAPATNNGDDGADDKNKGHTKPENKKNPLTKKQLKAEERKLKEKFAKRLANAQTPEAADKINAEWQKELDALRNPQSEAVPQGGDKKPPEVPPQSNNGGEDRKEGEAGNKDDEKGPKDPPKDPEGLNV